MEQENRVRMERIAADPQSGLSAEQVKRRFAQGENNYKVESSTLSVPEIVRSNVCTYFNLVFAVIAVLLAIVGAWSDMLFLPIIVANTCIGIIQEVHSKKVLDKLSILNAPHAVVIRDGKRQEIPADQLVLDDIVEFSELHDFMNVPVKNFSSGMISRLAFSIATIGIPDILIVDEVLSVGDFRFQEKCKNRIKNMLDKGTTLLFVSHSIEQVEELCNKVVWLDKGNLKMAGESRNIAEIYSAS